MIRLFFRHFFPFDSTPAQVRDLRELRHGDHCLVGLNPIRKVFGWLDTTVMHMGSWEVLRFFHHFVMYDDVHHISALDRVPCTSGGDPARICEFSNTPQQAWTQVTHRDTKLEHEHELLCWFCWFVNMFLLERGIGIIGVKRDTVFY